jgi:O-antigen/teichoic acid export membrane protein
MGIVKKQVYKNAIVSYTGQVIGFVNTILLYPRFLKTEQIGLFTLLITLSVLYSLLASMGVPSIIVRYFPFFRTEDKRHNNFLRFTGWLALIGFVTATVLFLGFKPVITGSYSGPKDRLFIQYYYYLIPLSLFTIFFNFLEAFGKVIYRSIYSAVLKEVVLRLTTSISIGAMAFGFIDFYQFILIYVTVNGLICISLLISLALTGEFSRKKPHTGNAPVSRNEVMKYGLITLLSSSVYVMLQNADKYMLGAMAGLSILGVYGIYSNVAAVINVPAQALSRTTYQIVADSWKAKNMANIAEVYYKTSIIQMLIGCLLFVGILVNKQNLLNLLHKKEYATQFNVLILICLGYLVDITGGLNTYILTTSHKYKLITWLVIISSIVCVGLTYVLIPKFGGAGAAGAYLITITGINFCTWFYLKYRFKMQPFTYRHLIVILISLVAFFAGNYFWRMPNLYLDIAVRSLFTAIIYTALSYILNISEDLNDKINSVSKKALSFIK